MAYLLQLREAIAAVLHLHFLFELTLRGREGGGRVGGGGGAGGTLEALVRPDCYLLTLNQLLLMLLQERGSGGKDVGAAGEEVGEQEDKEQPEE